MLNNFIIIIALRYFKAKKSEKFISLISGFSLLGVAIGVAALIVVMAVMNGFHIQFTKNVIGLNGDIQITGTSDKYIANYDIIQSNLLTQDYIIKIIPNVVGQALAVGKQNTSGVIIKGLSVDDIKYKRDIVDNVLRGNFIDFNQTDVIAIGSELAHNLGVVVGDKLKLMSPQTITTAFGSLPRFKEFNIIAIFNSGMYDYDASVVLMPIQSAQTFFSIGNKVTLLEIYINDSYESETIIAKIRKNIDSDLRAISWMQTNVQFLNALAIERVTMFTILSLIILVAAFNIVSSLFMLVKDKKKDIAILKTLGASTKQILLIFICNGMIIGILGTAIGILLGIGFAINIDKIRILLESATNTKVFDAAIYFLYSLPSDVRLEHVFYVGLMSLGMSFFATIYPAYNAAKLNPVDALRYE